VARSFSDECRCSTNLLVVEVWSHHSAPPSTSLAASIGAYFPRSKTVSTGLHDELRLSENDSVWYSVFTRWWQQTWSNYSCTFCVVCVVSDARFGKNPLFRDHIPTACHMVEFDGCKMSGCGPYSECPDLHKFAYCLQFILSLMGEVLYGLKTTISIIFEKFAWTFIFIAILFKLGATNESERRSREFVASGEVSGKTAKLVTSGKAACRWRAA